MKKRTGIFNTMMMGMCMDTNSMCMIYRTYLSEVFSISNVNPCTA